MKRIFRRREPGQAPRRGVASLFRGRARGRRLPGYKRIPTFRLPARLKRWPWQPAPRPATPPLTNASQSSDATQETEAVLTEAPPPSFKDRGRLRRRLRFLRRARELGFRDIGGLIFDMRRFERSRPDLLDAKLDALLAVDDELRALERILDDRRPFHELREPGISSCARCGALHSSEANFCPECGMQFSGPRAMGEVGGAIAAPPQAPAAPGAAPPVRAQSPPPGQQEWPWPAPVPPADQPTAPTVTGDPVTDQLTVAYVPVLQEDPPKDTREAPATAPAEPPAKPEAPAEPPTPEAQAPTPTPDADGASSPQPTEKPPAVRKPRKPAAKKPAARKPATKRPPAPEPAAEPTDGAKPADPHEHDIPADEQQTESHLPPPAPGGS